MPTSTTSHDPRIAACFDLDNQAERFMLGVLDRFHNEPKGLRTLAEIRRIVRGGQRVILTATCFRPRRPGAPPEWDLIEWNVDDVSLRFHRQPSQAAALRSLLQEPDK